MSMPYPPEYHIRTKFDHSDQNILFQSQNRRFNFFPHSVRLLDREWGWGFETLFGGIPFEQHLPWGRLPIHGIFLQIFAVNMFNICKLHNWLCCQWRPRVASFWWVPSQHFATNKSQLCQIGCGIEICYPQTLKGYSRDKNQFHNHKHIIACLEIRK